MILINVVEVDTTGVFRHQYASVEAAFSDAGWDFGGALGAFRGTTRVEGA